MIYTIDVLGRHSSRLELPQLVDACRQHLRVQSQSSSPHELARQAHRLNRQKDDALMGLSALNQSMKHATPVH